MHKVFIDGKEGTTGLQIYERLANRNDIELLLLSDIDRKNVEKRKEMINKADIVFLCLPDSAAIEAVTLVSNPNVKIIDASTAHRTNPDWDYGFPELGLDFLEKIKTSKRVANPGCHATGFISIVYPLRNKGLINSNCPINCFSITGYTGGGKKMINDYTTERDAKLDAPMIYALKQNHKHLKECVCVCSLDKDPFFIPIVCDFPQGMNTTVIIDKDSYQVNTTVESVYQVLYDFYLDQKMISVKKCDDITMLGSNILAGKDTLEIYVYGSDDRICISACFDNLGKGASGAAVESMNIMLGLELTTSLEV